MLLDVHGSSRAAAAQQPGRALRQGAGGAADPFGEGSIQYHKRRSRRLLRVALGFSDVVMISASFALMAYMRLGPYASSHLTTLLTVLLPIYLGIAFNSGAFSLDAILSVKVSNRRALAAFIFAISSVVLVAFFLKASADFSRLVFGAGAALSFPMIALGRMGVARIGRVALNGNPFVELMICDGADIKDRGEMPAIDAREMGLSPDVRDPLSMQRLGGIVRNVDRIVVACAPEKRTEWAFLLHSLDIRADICLPEFDDIGAISMGRVADTRTLVISAGPMALKHVFTKRVFDLAIVFAALPLLVIPMILVAIAIKLETPGPVFFRQMRIGLGNRPFYIFKFRSMRVEGTDSKGNRSASRDDDRITRVGNFIRKTSIDELPQILNVLNGDMSIVGPRPHAIGSRAENLLFWDIDDRYWHRHAVKPGLTGLAQIRGFRGATEVREDLTGRLQADLEYRANWTLGRDISILFATFKVLVHRNAF